MTIAFFNNKGGVGKTSLVYHLAHMFANFDLRVLCLDLDPQSNLTSMFLSPTRLESLFQGDSRSRTILGCVEPILEGVGDYAEPIVENITSPGGESVVESIGVGLIPGDLGLSAFEDRLSDAWPRALNRDRAALRSLAAFARIIEDAASKWDADVALIDVGPNLGAINRAALIGAEHVVVPLAPDLFSMQGLRNLGPTLRTWRQGWHKILAENPDPGFFLPAGKMEPAGYVVLQHAVRLDRPVEAYARWMRRIPAQYSQWILEVPGYDVDDVREDPHCLSILKNYRSLMPLAQEARKPMFALRQADGALGAQQQAVRSCYQDFAALATAIAMACGLDIPGVARA
ncbi:MAG TPA: AAA family ATPase [Candidatus Aquilonibacter sp.]